MKKRTYDGKISFDVLSGKIDAWFKGQGFETQQLEDKRNVIIQAKKGGLVSNIIGTAQALTVRLIHSDHGYLEVEIGQAKWIDKAAAGAISWFFFAPLILTAGFGVYNQNLLINNLWHFIDRTVLELKLAETTESQKTSCPSCNSPFPNGRPKFCSNCGYKLA